MCFDSLARCALAGWIELALALRAPASPGAAPASRSRGRDAAAQLAGDRDVALGMSEPDRRGDVQGALAGDRSTRCTVPGRAGRRRPRARSANSRSARFTCTGSRAWGRVPRPPASSSSPPVASASAPPVRDGRDRGRACRGSTSTGQRTRRARSSWLLAAASGVARVGRRRSISVSGVVSSAQPTHVLDLLGRVRLGEAAARRTTRGSRDSRGASSGALNFSQQRGQSARSIEPFTQRVGHQPPAQPCKRAAGNQGPMNTAPATRSGWLGAEQQTALRAPRSCRR